MSGQVPPAGRGASTPRRRRWLPWALVVAFVVVPLVEIYVLVQVGQVIGAWWTIALLIADSILGGWLMKREGAKAWRALSAALSSGRMPGRELADAAIILVAGTLMLTPGFVSDVLGFALLLPFTRPVARRLLAAVVTRRLLASQAGARPGSGGGLGGGFGPGFPGAAGPGDARRPGPGGPGAGPVVRGEVVDE